METTYEPAVRESSPSSDAARALTILVLEDHNDYRQLLSLAVLRAGHRVAEAIDGVDALGYLTHHAKPDLIFCDLRMPRMDGDEFIGALKSRDAWSDIPVVLISAEPNARAIADRYRIGFLQKSRFSPLRDLPEQVKHYVPT
jgi:chemotaxis family two-component system sensor histidine kinase/response regulator PixL